MYIMFTPLLTYYLTSCVNKSILLQLNHISYSVDIPQFKGRQIPHVNILQMLLKL